MFLLGSFLFSLPLRDRSCNMDTNLLDPIAKRRLGLSRIRALDPLCLCLSFSLILRRLPYLKPLQEWFHSKTKPFIDILGINSLQLSTHHRLFQPRSWIPERLNFWYLQYLDSWIANCVISLSFSILQKPKLRFNEFSESKFQKCRN